MFPNQPKFYTFIENRPWLDKLTDWLWVKCRINVYTIYWFIRGNFTRHLLLPYYRILTRLGYFKPLTHTGSKIIDVKAYKKHYNIHLRTAMELYERFNEEK
jgi:hypothetical protein